MITTLSSPACVEKWDYPSTDSAAPASQLAAGATAPNLATSFGRSKVPIWYLDQQGWFSTIPSGHGDIGGVVVVYGLGGSGERVASTGHPPSRPLLANALAHCCVAGGRRIGRNPGPSPASAELNL